MKVLARKGEAEGLWLRAEQQSGGKGRQGRAWVSPSGNLYASGLVKVRDDDPPAATLAFVASLALYQTVSAVLPDSAVDSLVLKWPNDLMLDGKKLSGILLEREGDAVIVGIGVNLAHYPEGLDRPATSIAEYGQTPEPDIVLSDLAGRFSALLQGWRALGLPPLLANWLRHAHPDGTPLSVHDGDGEPLEGGFAGLSDEGALQLRLADGSLRVMHAGDVFLI